MEESKYLKENIHNIQKLLELPTLGNFETEELGRLLRVSKIRKYAKEESIFRENEMDQWLYFLISGEVRIIKQGQELTRMRRRGDVFGEMGVIGHTDRSASAVAAVETVCLTTDAKRLEHLSGKDKMTFGYLFYRILAEVVTERLRTTSEELVSLKAKIKDMEKKSS